MKYYIDRSKCIGCGTCDMECSFGAIMISAEGAFSIDGEICRGCGACIRFCPMDAVKPCPVS